MDPATPRKPGGPPTPAMMEVFRSYEAGEVSADVAAARFVELLHQSDRPIIFNVDRPFREALLRIQIAKGRVPPDTVLGPDE